MSVASVAQLLQEQGGSGGGSVNDVIGGTGISVTANSFGDYTINNDGVLDLTAGSGIEITETAGNYTITNIGGVNNDNIRGVVYKSNNAPYLTIPSNTVQSQQFLFNNFNINANTVINVTLSEYTTLAAGTVITSNALPIWQVINILDVNNGNDCTITINYIGLFETNTNLGLQSLNVLIFNP